MILWQKQLKIKTKKQRSWYLAILLGTLGAILSINLLIGKRIRLMIRD